MSEEYEAASEVADAVRGLREELDYIGKQLDNSNLGDRRERIATAAMAAIISNPAWNQFALSLAGVKEKEAVHVAAFLAVAHANALLLALNKGAEDAKPAKS